MILPDVNILIYAYNRDSAQHPAAEKWWEQALQGDVGPIGLAWVTILGFLRIVTSRTVLERPLRVEDAVAIARTWLQQDSVRVVTPGEQHSEILFRLLTELGTAANLTADAHLAALALEYRAQIASTDADFARFPGLRWFNPLSGRPRA
ncbi:MAG: PIN domain-containing protein [Acidobacteriia bacterium]|nr:PIN domain-containing protein [Terriglobia bacterium]